MKFLANENFPGPSVFELKKHGHDVVWILNEYPGISDIEVLHLAEKTDRIIVTHDSDYGELVFKYQLKPKAGIIYFRLSHFKPKEPAEILLKLIDEMDFSNALTVIDEQSVRKRNY